MDTSDASDPGSPADAHRRQRQQQQQGQQPQGGTALAPTAAAWPWDQWHWREVWDGMDALPLRFKDRRLERPFLLWHAQSMRKVGGPFGLGGVGGGKV